MLKKIKSRFLCFVLAIVSLFSTVGTIPAFAADTTSQPLTIGGWSMVMVTTNVTCTDGTPGTVFIGEGVSFISTGSNDDVYIQYSGTNGPRYAYVNKSILANGDFPVARTALGTVTTNTSTYYGNSPALPLGSVSTGELVAILGENSGWYYIEYNVPGGIRKRGFVPTNTIEKISIWQVSTLNPTGTESGNSYTVYGGPSSRYGKIGEIYSSDTIVFRDIIKTKDPITGNTMYFVSYPASGSEKFGWIYK